MFRSFLQYYYLDSYKQFDFFGLITFDRATAAAGFSSVVMYSWYVLGKKFFASEFGNPKKEILYHLYHLLFIDNE
jgi:hypothetical protein